MKKKAATSRKRLSITKSTLRRLTKDQLSRVGGGEDRNGLPRVPNGDTYDGCVTTR